MLRRNAVSVPGILLAGGLAGCVGATRTVGGRTATSVIPEERALVRGPEVWAKVEGKVQYRENVQVRPERRDLIVMGTHLAIDQRDPAPHKTDMPEPGATVPLTLEGAARNLTEDIRRARGAALPSREDLRYDEMAALEEPALGILQHAREIVRVFERRAFLARLERGYEVEPPEAAAEAGEERPEPGEAEAAPEGRAFGEAEVAALPGWIELARRIEMNAERFQAGVAMRSPERVNKAWEALLDSGLALPQARPAIEAMRLEKAPERREEPVKRESLRVGAEDEEREGRSERRRRR
jgi:hypothetical protein